MGRYIFLSMKQETKRKMEDRSTEKRKRKRILGVFLVVSQQKSSFVESSEKDYY